VEYPSVKQLEESQEIIKSRFDDIGSTLQPLLRTVRTQELKGVNVLELISCSAVDNASNSFGDGHSTVPALH